MNNAGEEPEVNCRICGEAISENTENIVCIKCQTPHHKDCWSYYGRCAIYGCSNNSPSMPRVRANVEPSDEDVRNALAKLDWIKESNNSVRGNSKIIGVCRRSEFRIVLGFIPLLLFVTTFAIPKDYVPIWQWLIPVSVVLITIYLTKTSPKDESYLHF